MRRQETKPSRYRERLRARGLRPVRIWAPDTRREGFAEECRRQALSVRNEALERETLDWLAAVADTRGWTQ